MQVVKIIFSLTRRIKITTYNKNAAALANDVAFSKNSIEVKDESNLLNGDITEVGGGIEDKVNLTVLDTLSRDELSDSEKISIFNSIDKLSEDDLKYIIDNAKSEALRDYALSKTQNG